MKNSSINLVEKIKQLEADIELKNEKITSLKKRIKEYDEANFWENTSGLTNKKIEWIINKYENSKTERYKRIEFLMLNDKDRFKEESKKIFSLNIKLKKEEERIRIVAERMHISLEKQLTEKIIDDYNFYVSLSIWSNKEDCNNRHLVDLGDPFYEDESYGMFYHFTDESFYSDDWNEWKHRFPEPYDKEPMCYTMHCLWDHCNLNWQDLLDIDKVRLELKVDYQFFVKTPIKRKTNSRV